MNHIEAMKQALEALKRIKTQDMELAQRSMIAISAIEEALAEQPAQQQEPVALKRGECWPEDVMQMWDHYRKEIANGNTGSEPRDWFESLAEMRLVDGPPPASKPEQQEPVARVVESAPINAAGETLKAAYLIDKDLSDGTLLYTSPPASKPLTDEQIDRLMPPADGSAEKSKTRIEVQPGVWGMEYEEVDAWSLPLVRQAIRAIEAKLKEKNT